MCLRAQWEIRDLFHQIRATLDDHCPEVARYMVPKCMTHEVPFCEEAKCCGKALQLKDYIKGKDNR